jgi:hypothetical protein
MQIDKLERIWGFDPDNGTNQLKENEFDRAIAYGEYRCLTDLFESIRDNTFLNV